MDESYVYYGTLRKRESETEESLFSKLKSRSEYTYMEITPYWHDAEGNYSEEYARQD